MSMSSGSNFKGEVQDQPAESVVEAGIADLRIIYKCGGLSFPISLTVTVPTRKRGVHMSRLVGAVLRNSEGRNIEDALRAICREVDSTQDGCRVRCGFQFPVQDQFMDVTVELRREGIINYSFRKFGITACPCSKEECGIGHMQRSYIYVEIPSETVIDFIDVAGKLDSCFSTTLSEHLKRSQEASKILEAQARPRFVEDLVRECILLFPTATYVEARSQESIHAHDAVAFTERKGDA
jgi:GTP cyclohydrolase FolE2